MDIHARHIAVNGRHRQLLPPTSLRVAEGQLALVRCLREEGTTLALALGGRLDPDDGAVLLDGEGDMAGLRERVALVDSPRVTEPEPVLPLAAVVSESLRLAGVPGGRATVEDWLAEQRAEEYANLRFETLPAPLRTRLLVELAVADERVRMLVLDSPDRHTSEAQTWWSVAMRQAQRGLGVIVTCADGTARQLHPETAKVGQMRQPPPILVGADGVRPATTHPAESGFAEPSALGAGAVAAGVAGKWAGGSDHGTDDSDHGTDVDGQAALTENEPEPTASTTDEHHARDPRAEQRSGPVSGELADVDTRAGRHHPVPPSGVAHTGDLTDDDAPTAIQPAVVDSTAEHGAASTFPAEHAGGDTPNQPHDDERTRHGEHGFDREDPVGAEPPTPQRHRYSETTPETTPETAGEHAGDANEVTTEHPAICDEPTEASRQRHAHQTTTTAPRQRGRKWSPLSSISARLSGASPDSGSDDAGSASPDDDPEATTTFNRVSDREDS